MPSSAGCRGVRAHAWASRVRSGRRWRAAATGEEYRPLLRLVRLDFAAGSDWELIAQLGDDKPGALWFVLCCGCWHAIWQVTAKGAPLCKMSLFPPKRDIETYWTRECGGNVHEKEGVTAIASGRGRSEAKIVTNPETTLNFSSESSRSSAIRYNFKG